MRGAAISNQPLISVIIPVYNSGKYLPQCIKSVCRQTYENIEIILVNDGSTDDSLKIIQTFAREDSRIKVINQKNSGGIIARRNGIQRAKGEYVLIEDSDDWLDSNLVEKCVQFLNENKELDIIRFGYICEPSKVAKNVLNDNRINKTVLEGNEINQVIKLLSYDICFNSIWNQMVRKSLFDFNDVVFEQIVHKGEDVQINLQIYQKAKRIGFLKDNLYHYVDNPDGITNDISASKVIRNVKDNIYLNLVKRRIAIKYFRQADELYFTNSTLSLLSGKIVRILANSKHPKEDILQIENGLKDELTSYLAGFNSEGLDQKVLKKTICSNIINGRYLKNLKYIPICKVLKIFGLIK